MCVSYWIHGPPDSPFKLVLASNRDEFLARKTARASFSSNDSIISGLDLERQDGSTGTWLGMSRDGRVSFLTNYREKILSPDTRSRGVLPMEYLASSQGGKEYCESAEADLYNGFNLVVGNVNDSSLYYTSNRPDKCVKELEAGKIYGISNGALDIESEWPKVTRGKQLFANENMKELADMLIRGLLSDPQSCDIPRDMFNDDLERQLASTCVPKIKRLSGFGSAEYATRTHTVIIVDKNDHVLFVEVERFSRTESGDFIPDENKLEFNFNLQ